MDAKNEEAYCTEMETLDDDDDDDWCDEDFSECTTHHLSSERDLLM